MALHTLMLRAAAFGLAALLCASPSPIRAQDAVEPTGAILVLNQERLLAQTLFGQRLQVELEQASAALSAENRQIETQLMEEELELTEIRPTIDAAEFRALADEFDARVTAIRAAQDAKTRDLQTQTEAARQQFFQQSVPVLLEVIEARGAAILLDSRTVLLSAEGVDVTDEAIAAIDAAIGDGGSDPIISLPGIDVLPVE